MNENAIIKGYITNLKKYNEGELIGKWIEFPVDDDELQQVLKEIGCCYTDENDTEHNTEYEEFFFSDWDCEIPFDFGEYESISDVNDIAERVEPLKDYEQDALKVILEEHTKNVEEALQIVEEDRYITWWNCDCMADVAEAMAKEYGYLDGVPGHLQYYIDYERWGRDLDIDGIFLEGNGFFVEVLN